MGHNYNAELVNKINEMQSILHCNQIFEQAEKPHSKERGFSARKLYHYHFLKQTWALKPGGAYFVNAGLFFATIFVWNKTATKTATITPAISPKL